MLILGLRGCKYWFRAKTLMAEFIVLSNYLQALDSISTPLWMSVKYQDQSKPSHLVIVNYLLVSMKHNIIDPLDLILKNGRHYLVR